jgi:hypothetical protein
MWIVGRPLASGLAGQRVPDLLVVSDGAVRAGDALEFCGESFSEGWAI